MKRSRIGNKQSRFLLCDTLPYEIPIIYSNRFFVSFLLQNKIEVKLLKEKKIKISIGRNDFLKSDLQNFQQCLAIILNSNNVNVKNKDFSLTIPSTIPYDLFIPRADKSDRKLSIIHPINQLSIMAFYNQFSDFLIYETSKSLFSIRYPYKKSSWKYFYDKSHYISLVEKKNADIIEEFGSEYEELKSFFVYKDYSNIYKFYNSHTFIELEKRFKKMAKLDVSKFFDSIYTHSIAWCIFEKDYIKENLNNHKNSVSDMLDYLMQLMNYNETNGIVIGPEFSRIFAEIIMQKSDLNIAQQLSNEKILFGKDYSIKRYVDDYFVFYNKDEDYKKIIEIINTELQKNRYYVNDSKTIIYEKRPVQTNISLAKYHIEQLLNGVRIEEKDEDVLSIQSINFIDGFKSIIQDDDVSIDDVINYSLALLEKKIIKIIMAKNKKFCLKKISVKNFQFFYIKVIEFLFYVLNVSSSFSTVLRVCRIVMVIINDLKQAKRIKQNIPCIKIYDYVFSEIYSILEREDFSIKSSYLLVLSNELGRNYLFPPEKFDDWLELQKSLDYFTAISLLFYFKNRKMYKKLQEKILENVKGKLSYKNSIPRAEQTMLTIDILSCPFIEKEQIKNLFENSNLVKKDSIVSLMKYLRANRISFTNWYNLNFAKELDLKKAQFVY